MQELDLDGPHWRFALAVYRQPGVSEACLGLQDGYGVDVNMLLLALYAASVGDAGFAGERLGSIEAAIAPTRDRVVKPLRGIRRAMKEMGEAGHGAAWESVRNKVKSAELAAEQFEQALIAAKVEPGGPADKDFEAAAQNVVIHYAAVAGADPAGASDAIATLAAAAAEAARQG